MEKVKLDDALRAAFGELRKYLDLQLRYNKILLAKKMGEVLSYLALFTIVLIITGFLLIFLSFAFAEWFNDQFNLPYGGHLIIAGFYLLMAVFVVIFRRPLIFNPMRKLFGDIIFGDDDDDSIYEEAFKSPGALEVQMRIYREQIRKKEVELNGTFQELSENLTISHIFQTIVKNLYTTYVTTSNVMRTAYSLVSRITGKRKQKLKKKKRREYYEDEDED